MIILTSLLSTHGSEEPTSFEARGCCQLTDRRGETEEMKSDEEEKAAEQQANDADQASTGASLSNEEGNISAEDKFASALETPGFLRYVSDLVLKEIFARPTKQVGPTQQVSVGSGDTQYPRFLRYVSGLNGTVHGSQQSSLEQEQRQPGAYPQGRSDALGPSNHCDLQTGSNHHRSILEDGLAVARPIVNEDPLEEGGQAERIELAAIQERQAEQERKTRQCVASGLFVSCILLVGLILLLVFVVGGVDSKSATLTHDNNKTPAPAPVASDETLLLSLLPPFTTEAIHADTSSPQAQAFDWLLNDPSFHSYPDWRKVQRFALAIFYFATNGQRWHYNTNWMSYNHSECEWDSRDGYGLPDAQGEATRYGLTATFPAIETGLCNATDEGRVERLVQTANNMHGSLPAELSLLTSMRVFVSLGNPIGTTIPSEIGLLPHLEFLGLALGDLKGTIPTQLGCAPNLTHLVLLNNQLSGTVPTQLGTLSKLKGLMLDENNLEGTLPTELGLLSNAIWLSTFTNSITGSIPSQLGQLSLLRSACLRSLGTTILAKCQASWVCCLLFKT